MKSMANRPAIHYLEITLPFCSSVSDIVVSPCKLVQNLIGVILIKRRLGLLVRVKHCPLRTIQVTRSGHTCSESFTLLNAVDILYFEHFKILKQIILTIYCEIFSVIVI